MALTLAPTMHRTCSGVFLRMDQGFGLLAHSPYTGLTYAIDPSDADGVSQWLKNQRSEPPADHYQYSLGAGWAVPLEKSRQPVPQLLPGLDTWPTLPMPRQPILINWLILPLPALLLHRHLPPFRRHQPLRCCRDHRIPGAQRLSPCRLRDLPR